MFDIYHYPYYPKKERGSARTAKCPKHQMELHPGTVAVRNEPVGGGDSGWREISVLRCPLPGCPYY